MADYSWPNVSMLEGCGEMPLHPPFVPNLDMQELP
jgi:hypothetical protein